MNENLYALLESRFPREAQAPLLLLEGGRVLTYSEMDATSARYATLLASRGLQPGDRVAAQVGNSPEALMLYLACLRAGLAYLPLNNAYQEGEIRYFLENAQPRAVVTQPRSMPWLGPLTTQLGIEHVFTLNDRGDGSLTQGSRALNPYFETVERRGDDLAAILYTSGTTGRSKGAMITHRNLSSNAQVLHQEWGFRPDDVLIHMLPLFHVHGLFVSTHCVLLNGTAMRFHAKFDAKRALAEFKTSTVFMGVPTYYTRLLAEAGLDRDACSRMRLFVSGSAPLAAETLEDFEGRTGFRILERYGMTETGMLTSNPLDGERRVGTVGKPLPGTELRVVDDEDHPLPVGEVGHIQVRGPSVLPGYWQMPEKNAEEFTDGFFRTGDMGSVSPDGYITIVGRSKDLIITGGYNVYPKEIELAIDEIEGVQESAVVGVAHADFGEAVTAVIVRKPGADRPNEKDVIASLKARLANFKVPKQVHFVEELPRNAMGKVQKNVLRDQYVPAKAARR